MSFSTDSKAQMMRQLRRHNRERREPSDKVILDILKKHLVLTENQHGAQYIIITANGKCPTDHYLFFGEMNRCKEDFEIVKNWLKK